ncbi:MAG: restriction endonuclease subunit S [bacterium]
MNAQIVKTFKVVLPETSEQQVIANILKIVDNAIGIVESIIKNLENRNK